MVYSILYYLLFTVLLVNFSIYTSAFNILPSDGPRDCLNFLRIEYEYSFILEKKKRRKSEACIYDAPCFL